MSCDDIQPHARHQIDGGFPQIAAKPAPADLIPFLYNPDLLLAAIIVEIFDGQHPDIGLVIPFKGQRRRFWRAPTEE